MRKENLGAGESWDRLFASINRDRAPANIGVHGFFQIKRTSVGPGVGRNDGTTLGHLIAPAALVRWRSLSVSRCYTYDLTAGAVSRGVSGMCAGSAAKCAGIPQDSLPVAEVQSNMTVER